MKLGLMQNSRETRIKTLASIYCLKLLLLLVVVVVVVAVFSPWASLGRNQSPVRRPGWLWYAASWATS